MSIYNITKGQLITLWVFGFFWWALALPVLVVYFLPNFGDPSDPPLASLLLVMFIPFLLTFYTLGWRNNKRP